MSDIAAHLVDEVLPRVPVRQWVCSLPWRLRNVMGYDRRLHRDVLAAFIGALRRSLRRRAKRELVPLSDRRFALGWYRGGTGIELRCAARGQAEIVEIRREDDVRATGTRVDR